MNNIYKQKFYSTYANLLPEMVKLEKDRCSRLFRIFFVPSLLTFLNILLPVLFIGQSTGTAFSLFWLLLFVNLAISIPCNFAYLPSNCKEFSHTLKRYFFDDLLSSFDFIKKTKISLLSDDIKDSLINFNKNADDCFTGCYNGVKFLIVEFCNTGKDKDSAYHNISILLDFNKLIKTEVEIRTKAEEYLMWFAIVITFLISVASWFKNQHVISVIIGAFVVLLVFAMISDNQKYAVKLEDNSFHKKFIVRAQDQIEARYLLTPAFMERLKNFKTAFGTKYMQCTFKGNRLVLNVKVTDDLFEIGNLFVPTKSSKQVQRFYDEVMAITEIIDHFKLNEKTGL